MQSDNEDATDKLMNDFDTEFIAFAEIELTDYQGNVSALTLEANVHAVFQGTAHEITRDKQKDKKSQKRNVHMDHMETQRFPTSKSCQPI